MLEIKDLSFAYPDGREALRGVDLSLEAGERVALLGPNGAGKSTLLLHLNGILRGQGSLTVDGTPVEERHLSRVRALVGLVFQDPDDQLFTPTVMEDVAFGPLYMGLPAEEVRARSRRALEAVGLAEHGERCPHHLSGGEKKRVALATVLSMEPRLLALDEPTAGLDPRARRGLIELLGSLPQAMLVSTHDLPFVHDLFPRVVLLDEGRVVADGPTGAILADEKLLLAHGL